MATRADILPIISMGQSLSAGALAGASAGMSNDNTVELLEDLRDIGRRNEENTEAFVNILGMQFAFDKERFRRERDQLREQNKENLRQRGEGVQLPGAEALTGGFGVKGLAALAALAFFMKDIGMNTDILKLPQQLKSVRAIGTFVKGLANIGTLGLGGKLIDDAKAAIKAFKVDPSSITKSIKTMFDDTFKGIANMLKGTPDNPSVFTRITNSFTKQLDTVKDTFTGLKTTIQNSKAFTGLTTFADDIATSISKTFKPFKDAVMAIFKPAAAGAGAAGAGAAAGSGVLAAIIAPLKGIASAIGKIFLPLTIILGVFDGYKGFEEEYKDEKSILDGLRGAIKGIIDGFVGSFVSIIGSAFNLVLGFFGLDKTGELIGGEEGIANDIRTALNKTVGGLVDLITGLFSFNPDRVKEGLGQLLSGTVEWAQLLFTPIDLAVNFVKDLFGLNDDDNDEPFRFKDFLFGEDGIIQKAIDFIKDIFTIDFSALGTKFFDMGKMLKAIVLASGSYTATAMNPFTKGDNLEAASKAYEETYNEVMGTGSAEVESGDMTGSAESIEKNIDMSKTETLNEGDQNKSGPDVIIGSIDQSIKDQKQVGVKQENAYANLNTSSDGFFERDGYNQAAFGTG